MSFIKNLVKTSIATGITAAVGSAVTDPDTLWYKMQDKPEWQPPQQAFPIAWTALYASIAGASAVVLTKLDKKKAATAGVTETIKHPTDGRLTEGELEEAIEGARYDASDIDPKDIKKERRAFKRALGVNLVLNAGWSYLFWQGRNNWVSTAQAGALAVSSIDLARRAGKVSKGAGLALVPYAAWTTFATALTGSIAQRNN